MKSCILAQDTNMSAGNVPETTDYRGAGEYVRVCLPHCPHSMRGGGWSCCQCGKFITSPECVIRRSWAMLQGL